MIQSQGANATIEFGGPKWLDDLLWKVPALHHHFESQFRIISYPESTGQAHAPLDLSYLPDVPELEGLSLDHMHEVTDNDLAFIGQLRRLRKLTVDSPLVTDAGVQQLGPLAELEELCLESTQVTDDGLRFLQGMPSLKRLLLPDSSAINGDGLSNVPRDCRLEDLWLQNTRFDHGLEHIDLSRLNRLIATDTPLSNAGLEQLREAVSLEQLWIARTQVTDAGLAHVGGLPRLVTIQLQGTRITDAGLEHLAGLKSLEILLLTETAVTEAGARRLSEKLPALEIGIGPSRREMRWVRGGSVPQ